jgi:hypothetical protein
MLVYCMYHDLFMFGMYVHTYIYIYIYIHIHTHTHIHTVHKEVMISIIVSNLYLFHYILR